MATLDDLRKLGYTAGTAFVRDDGKTVYAVAGPGFTGYLGEDDEAGLRSIASHAARARLAAVNGYHCELATESLADPSDPGRTWDVREAAPDAPPADPQPSAAARVLAALEQAPALDPVKATAAEAVDSINAVVASLRGALAEPAPPPAPPVAPLVASGLTDADLVALAMATL